MSTQHLATARARIADCFQLDEGGELVQRRNYLNLSGLELTDAELTFPFVPEERNLPEISLADFADLRYLDLTGNQLTELPEPVAKFTSLVWLGLNFNQLTSLGGIGALVHLQRLYLRANALTALPEEMGNLRRLVELDLTANALTQLPTAMGHLTALEYLAVDQERLDPDLRAAWKEKEWSSLQPYLLKKDREALEVFRHSEHYRTTRDSLAHTGQIYAEIVAQAKSMHELRVTMNEPEVRAKLFPGEPAATGVELFGEADWPTQCLGKVLLIGAQEHGKTCLQRALRGEPFVEGHKSTPGMSRERLHLGLGGDLISAEERAEMKGPQEEVIDLTLWDMGGQESYQHAHQMFFTPSAVYLLVTHPREGGSIDVLHQWIDLVKRRTDGEATLIVVSTCCQEKAPDEAIKLTDLQAKHGEMVRAIVAVDSKDNTGIPELRRLLAEVIQEPRTQCRHTWLPGWAEVLDDLGNLAEAFLRWPEIRELCERRFIHAPEEQRAVIRAGHYIGTLLWREDIPAGEEVVILNPDWLSRAVARLLDDEETQKAHGLVDTGKLDRVWAGPGRDGTPGYAPDTYPALIELMEINELAYRPRVPGKKVGEGHLLLLTQMVEDLPKRGVDEAWENIRPKDAAQTVRVIAFRKVGGIVCGEVPDLIYLLIFRLREFSLGRDNFKEAVHWQNGLLVADDYGSVGRIELAEGQLRITVLHRLGDGLMHSIVHRIGVRDDGHWNGRGLEKVEFIPCGAVCAKGTPDAGLIEMESCVKADRVGNKAIECQSCREFVSIRDLLNQRAVEPLEARQLMAWLQRSHAEILQELRTQGEATRERIGELRQFVEMQGDGIIDQFYSESKEGPRLFSLIPIPGSGWNPQTWTHMTFRVTVWCEAARHPVPFFGEKKDDSKEFKGSETITLTREWVQKGRRLLTWGAWATLAGATGGAAGVGGLVAASGEVIAPEDTKEIAAELARQQRALKELANSIPDDSKDLLRESRAPKEDSWADSFSSLGRKGYGTPVQDELALIRHLREAFRKQDPTWGGLEPRKDGKFGRIWAHPRSETA